MNYREIENSVTGAKNGDSQELNKVLEQYKPFIYKTAKQYNLKNYDLNDLVQIGYMALMKAVVKYRTGSNTFSTYAFNAIKNELRYTARQNNRHNEDLSLNSPVNTSGNAKIEYIDCIESKDNLEDHILKSEKISEVNNVVSKLPSDEADLVSMIFYNKNSIKNYAEKKGLSYLQAVRKKNKILKKLNNQLLN